MTLKVWDALGRPISESQFGPWQGPWQDMAVLGVRALSDGKVTAVHVAVKRDGRWFPLGKEGPAEEPLPWTEIRFIEGLPVVTMPDGALALPGPDGRPPPDPIRLRSAPSVTRTATDAWWVACEGPQDAASDRRVIRRRDDLAYAVALVDVRPHGGGRTLTGRSTSSSGPFTSASTPGVWATYEPAPEETYSARVGRSFDERVKARPEPVEIGGEVVAWRALRESASDPDLTFPTDPAFPLLSGVEGLEVADLRALVPALSKEKDPVVGVFARVRGARGWSVYLLRSRAFASRNLEYLFPRLHAAPEGSDGTLAEARAAVPGAWAAHEARVAAELAHKREAAAEAERLRRARAEERRAIIAENERQGRPCIVVDDAVHVGRPTAPTRLPERSLVHTGGAWHMAVRSADAIRAWPIRYDDEARKGAITGPRVLISPIGGDVPAIVGASAYAAVEKVVGTPKVVAVECAACVGTGIEAYAVDTVDQFGGSTRGVYFKFGEHTGGMGRLFELPEWNVQKEAGTAKPWYAALAASGAAVIEVGARSEHRGQIVYPLPCPSCRGAGAFER